MNKQIIFNEIYVHKKAIRTYNKELGCERFMSNYIRREISKIAHSDSHRFRVGVVNKLNESKETIDHCIKDLVQAKKQRCRHLVLLIVKLDKTHLTLNEKAQIIGIDHSSLEGFYADHEEHGLVIGDLFGACSLHAENAGGRKSDSILSSAISMMMHDIFAKEPNLIDRAFDKLAEINGRPIPRYRQAMDANGKVFFEQLPPKLKVCEI